MIFENLPRVCDRGDDLEAREQMALASAYAGMAFTRANVGNVHAIAHQLGGKYHTPHGLANAIMLSHVLRFSASATVGRLATLALRARVGRTGDSREELARKFLDSVDTSAARSASRARLKRCARPTFRPWPRPPATRPMPTTQCRA